MYCFIGSYEIQTFGNVGSYLRPCLLGHSFCDLLTSQWGNRIHLTTGNAYPKPDQATSCWSFLLLLLLKTPAWGNCGS
uniref:Uncharacterized protein n=1 Tax=Naja naja TaxID=35670 RepID=A0A8C6X7E7_NAJNA